MSRKACVRGRQEQISAGPPNDDPFAVLRSVLDLLPVGVLLVSGDEPVSAVRLAFNGCFAQLFGMNEDDPPTELPLYYQSDHTTLIPLEEWPGRRAIRTGEPVHNTEMHACGVDGVWRALLVSASPIWHQGQIRGAVVISRDASELHQAKEEARAREELARKRARELEVVLATVPAAVIITRDRESRTVELNRFTADLIGIPPDIGNGSLTLLPDRNIRFRAFRNGKELPRGGLPIQVAAREGEDVKDAEFDLVFDDGSVHHFLGNASAITDAQGEPQGAVGAFVDITERRRAEEALREADRRKDQFLAILSHELRNPLAPIRNSLAVLNKIRTGDRAERALGVMDRQLKHISRLVDDLLDVSRIASGKITLRRSPLDVREVVRRAAEDNRSVMDSAELHLSLELPTRPLVVNADHVRLEQVIGNLLQNAAKFTLPGGRVVAGVREDRAEKRVCVFVKDSGAGFDAQMRERLFQPFAQADATLDRPGGGLGLGLALVKGLIDLHGGVVQAHSEGPGTGAEFSFSLPLIDAVAKPRKIATSLPSGPRRRVLIVEDNEDAAMSLRDLLEFEGHDVRLAPDGSVGIEMACRLRPDVVFCDIGLPGMNGYQVAKALRAREFSSKLVALTGYASAEDERLAFESGFDEHVAKPADPERLAAILADEKPRP